MLHGGGLRLASDDGWPTGDQPASERLPLPGPEALDPWRFFRMLRRQAWFVLAVILAFNLLTLLGLSQIPPIYKTSALVIVDPWQQSMLDADRSVPSQPADAARVESEVEILRSPSVLLAALRKLELAQDAEFAPRPGWGARLASLVGIKPPPLTPEQAAKLTLKKLGSSVAVTRRGATYVIEIAARSKDPDKAARIANALAAAYIDAQIRAKIDFAASVRQRLAMQLESARETLRELDRKLDSFLDDRIVQIEPPELRAELSEIRAAIREQEANRVRYDALAGRARELARKRDWEALIAELNSERMVRLHAQYTAIRRGLGAGQKDDTPTRLAQIDQQLDKEAQAVIGRIAAEASAAQQREAELHTRLSQRLANADAPAELVRHFREVESDAAALRLVVDKLTTNSTTATAEIDLQLPDSRVVSAALSPATPAYPDKPLILGLAGALSLILGLAAGILRDHVSGGIADEDELERLSNVPVLSALPTIPARADRPGENPATEVLNHPNDAYAEAVRRLRLGLDLSPTGRRANNSGRVVVVTAALPGEGATLAAISLARSLALSGRRTLLIDGNLRQPDLHVMMDLERRHGLASHLAGRGTAPSSDGLILDIGPHLSVAAGPADPRLNIDVLMQSSRLAALLQTARQNFEHVVIDSPSLLVAIDALQWSRHADDIVMVVAASTPPRDVRAGLRTLARGGHGTAHLWLALNHASGRQPNRDSVPRSRPAKPTPRNHSERMSPIERTESNS
jgi:succinoglycan biosynthesis transport protein ExoP